MSNDVPILLIGFNRPEKLASRVEELKRILPKYLYILIDWESPMQADYFSSYLESVKSSWNQEVKFHFEVQDGNNGLSEHITTAITRVLSRHESVIVVEGDFGITPQFFNFVSSALKDPNFAEQYAAASGFFILGFEISQFFQNKTHNSNYFYCWGWGTKGEFGKI